MTKYLIYILLSVSISLVLTPLVRILSKRANIYDIPSERKIHRNPTPLLGGIPIFLSFNLTLLIGYFLNNGYIREFLADKWKPLFLCQIIILGMGIFDDIIKLKPRLKFLIQIFAGSLLVFFGIGITDISNPFSGGLIHLGMLSIPVTILWVVGITNALNLIDGLDGLAAGTSLIVCIAFFGISFFFQDIGISFVSLILAGSVLGFLRYNFYPAKIFLGDSGSLLLGFLLAVLSIQGSYKGATLIAVLVPILVLGFPIMETLISMARRFLRSVHMVDFPNGNGKFKALFLNGFAMFEADKDHVHHRLLKLGISHKKVVLILYGLCAALCAFAFLMAMLKDINVTLFIVAIIMAFVIGIRSLKYQEFKILESGLLLPLFSFPVVNKRVFQAFFDLLFISLSFYFSFVLIFNNFGSYEKSLLIRTLPIVLVVKIAIFFASGLYNRSWSYSGIEDLLMLARSLVLSSVGSLLLLGLVFGLSSFGGILFFLIDFYIAATFIMGYRISFKLVRSLYNRNSGSMGKKVLIYGAGYRGSVALDELKKNGSTFYSPIGFIDDDIDKKGKIIHNCPILGSIEDIRDLVSQNDVAEILVSTDKIEKEKIGKLMEFCKQKGIMMRQFEFRFYEFPQFESE
jgi:UDP-GlcNAc:undecaprenyl-phosphate GlcNAc-1-phosphate transferase